MHQCGGSGLPSLTDTVKVIFPNLMSQQLQPIKYHQKAALCFGIVQMNLGVIFIISNIIMAATANTNMSSFMFYGIWGGILVSFVAILYFLHVDKCDNSQN